MTWMWLIVPLALWAGWVWVRRWRAASSPTHAADGARFLAAVEVVAVIALEAFAIGALLLVAYLSS